MKAIITDLDRTLLRTDKSVSEYTLSVLKECRAQGILLFAASARPIRAIREYDDLIGFDAITATNGAVISLPGKRLEVGISRESSEKILAALLQFPDLVLSVESSHGLYANQDIPLWEPVVYDGFPKLPEGVIPYKILASSTQSTLYAGIESILTDDVYHTISEGDLVQIMSKAATKWQGIRHMLAAYDVSIEEAIYFGDDNDDIEPIQNCGLGIAVANAIPSVLAVADQIVDSNDEDGVAQFIEATILRGKGDQ